MEYPIDRVSVYISVCELSILVYWSVCLSLHQWLLNQSEQAILCWGNKQLENIGHLELQKFISYPCYRSMAGLQGAPIISFSGILAFGAACNLGIAIHEPEEKTD